MNFQVAKYAYAPSVRYREKIISYFETRCELFRKLHFTAREAIFVEIQFQRGNRRWNSGKYWSFHLTRDRSPNKNFNLPHFFDNTTPPSVGVFDPRPRHPVEQTGEVGGGMQLLLEGH